MRCELDARSAELAAAHLELRRRDERERFAQHAPAPAVAVTLPNDLIRDFSKSMI